MWRACVAIPAEEQPTELRVQHACTWERKVEQLNGCIKQRSASKAPNQVLMEISDVRLIRPVGIPLEGVWLEEACARACTSIICSLQQLPEECIHSTICWHRSVNWKVHKRWGVALAESMRCWHDICTPGCIWVWPCKDS